VFHRTNAQNQQPKNTFFLGILACMERRQIKAASFLSGFRIKNKKKKKKKQPTINHRRAMMARVVPFAIVITWIVGGR